MGVHPLAGTPAPESILVDVAALTDAYFKEKPRGRVSFGTSGHRGSSLAGTFNELHVSAIAQAICEYRAQQAITGPLYLGFDTHGLSEPAFRTALEVFAANGAPVIIHAGDEYTPTPVISFLILEHNQGRREGLADGVVVTPSHNPPRDGGFKYNPPHGGPADVDVTGWIEKRANALMEAGGSGIKRIPYARARRSGGTQEQDFKAPFVSSLSRVVDLEAIKRAGVRIAADPMGGSGVHFWEPIAERYGLDLQVVNPEVDPTFRFMTVDSDGEIRMDCSSPYAMARLIGTADRFDIAWGNDPDFDRHGIVCGGRLMNPNHYLAVAVWYLLQNRPQWASRLKVGKTLVSSSMIDRVVAALNRELYEVPVGFKWFVRGLMEGDVAFGGEESAGASFLRMDGSVWSTDKDGFCMTLLAAEILAKTGRRPDEIYRESLVPQYGEPYYSRADGPITESQKARLRSLTPDALPVTRVAGQKIRSVMTKARGNGAAIGGVKVMLEDDSWFAIRPSGTEPKMKVYIESFGGEPLWRQIHAEAMPLIFGPEV
jgi:phosphoglucomutase